MKKTYMIPTLEVIKIESNAMLCLSAGMGGSQNNNEALARPGFYYDEEEN